MKFRSSIQRTTWEDDFGIEAWFGTVTLVEMDRHDYLIKMAVVRDIGILVVGQVEILWILWKL